MRYILTAVAFTLLFHPTRSFAQIPYIDSHEVLVNGIEQFEKGEYKKALEFYNQVHECDTNYAVAIYEKTNCLLADSSFEASKKLALIGPQLKDADKRGFLLELGNAYDFTDKADSALMIYDSMMKLYPNDNQAYYETGVTYARQKKYDLAAAYLQRSVVINPYDVRSHYLLGSIYLLQGRLSEAMMALETSLLMAKNIDAARSSIRAISGIVEETDEVNKAYSEKKEKYSNAVYDDIDQIVNAKLALNKDYKLKMELDDNIFRQSQVIMEKLRFDPSDTTFTMQYYVPFYTELFKKEMLEGYMLLIFSNFEIASIDAQAKRNKSEVAEVHDYVFPYFTQIQSTRELNYNKRKDMEGRYHFFPSDNFYLVGKLAKLNGKDIVQGHVSVYRNDHSKTSEGDYTEDGKLTGLWRYYYSTGELKAINIFRNDTLIDTAKDYYGNGNMRKLTIYDNLGNTTELFTYSYKGPLEVNRKLIKDNEYDETNWYANGQQKNKLKYRGNDVQDGSYTFYHENGVVEKVVPVKDGKASGAFKRYYDNGRVSSSTVFADGDVEGLDTDYYENGNLKSISNYHKGKQEGPYTEYYDNGVISETGTYNKGKKDGLSINYDRHSHKYVEMELDDYVPVSIKYFDADNKIYYSKEDKHGLDKYALYHTNGNKATDMSIDSKGLRDGIVSFYYYSGSKNSEATYAHGNLEGLDVSYYKNGRKKSEMTYKNDELDGYYKSYHENGTLDDEGWYKAGSKQGLWKTYYVNGKLSYEGYYLDNALNGYTKNYNINGEPKYKEIYESGMLIGVVMYDSVGKAYDSTRYDKGNGLYTLHYQNGIAYFQAAMKGGLCQGPFTKKYFNGSLHETGSFNFGSRDNIDVMYFPNGVKQFEGTYNNGKNIGNWKYYNEAGELVDETRFDKDGNIKSRQSYASGMLRIDYNYLDGEKDSAQIYYGDDGKVALVLYYDTGDLEGYAYEGKDGKLVPKIPLKSGSGKVMAYYSNGKKSAEAEYVENMIRGTQKIFYSNGNLAEERNCVGNELDGAFKRYNQDGKLIYELDYTSGEENGIENTYDKNGVKMISKPFYFGEPHGTATVTDPATHATKTYIYRYGDLITMM